MNLEFTAVFRKVPEGDTLRAWHTKTRPGPNHARAAERDGLKRRDLIRHLESHGCRSAKAAITIYANRAARKTSSVPRHNEINNELALT